MIFKVERYCRTVETGFVRKEFTDLSVRQRSSALYLGRISRRRIRQLTIWNVIRTISESCENCNKRAAKILQKNSTNDRMIPMMCCNLASKKAHVYGHHFKILIFLSMTIICGYFSFSHKYVFLFIKFGVKYSYFKHVPFS